MKLFASKSPEQEGDDQTAIRAEGVWAGYDGRVALEDVGFEVPRSTIVGLVGANGSGKSTLIKVMLGVMRPWRGSVRIMGKEPAAARNLIGYAPQMEAVDWQFPVTVHDVVMMGRYGRLGPLRQPGPNDRKVVELALERVQLSEMAKRQIGELSGGQQRRMLVARALAQEPQVFLLDEPMAGLDPSIQHELVALFESLRDEGKTLIVATHDISCVTCCFDRALLLNRRKVAYGNPSEVFTQENLNEAFQSHLILLPMEQSVYVEHHHE
ncbi:MAG: metal ABC transporter ATP-binding protein [Dehalococcoidia bacterium]|nr:metal ABC transporter ATP-binding protein [Dehalococcoidia bacterium]